MTPFQYPKPNLRLLRELLLSLGDRAVNGEGCGGLGTTEPYRLFWPI